MADKAPHDQVDTQETRKSLGVRPKILLVAAIGVLTALVIAAVGLLSLISQNANTKQTNEESAAVSDATTTIEREFMKALVQAASMRATEIPSDNQKVLAKYTESYDIAKTRADELVAWFERDGLYSENIFALPEMLEKFNSAVTGGFQTAVMDENKLMAENLRAVEIEPAAQTLTTALTELVAETADHNTQGLTASQAAANRSIMIVGIVTLVGAALAMWVGSWIARRILTDVEAVRSSLVQLSHGDLTTEATVQAKDEIGQMAAALNQAQTSLRRILTSVAESSDQSVRESEVLSATSMQLAAATNETSTQVGVVASAADEVSSNVQTVAAGSEQMSASIREIAQNAQEATSVARTAASTAEATNVTITRLGESSREIGDVIKSITSIAEQTNLLALNATIEAARAGEAGKGFAVVAGEVKELAAESARAAEDVSRRVEAIQNDTNSAVEAIGQIAEIISTINNYQMTIASAVEEQTATTNEMSRSAAEAAAGSSQIAANINSVAGVLEESTAAFTNLDQTIARVSGEATDLNGRVKVFTF
jgi:methyl-accepting chemotaxis protein